MAKKAKKNYDADDLELLKRQRSLKVKALEKAQTKSEREALLKEIADLESLIERISPQKDKISKADWLKTGLTAGMFLATFIPELKGHVVLKSPLRRFGQLPRLWGNELSGDGNNKDKKK